MERFELEVKSDQSRASTPRPLRCLQDVVDLPPRAFALPDDGRQRRHLCSKRKDVAVQLARRANPDGSGARPAVETIANAIGCHRATIFRLLKDLRTLGFLTDEEIHQYHGTRMRRLHVQRMIEAVPPVASSPAACDKSARQPCDKSARQNPAPPVASSRPSVASSQVPVASSFATQPPLRPSFLTAQSEAEGESSAQKTRAPQPSLPDDSEKKAWARIA
jgi:hypothetical protein